MHTLAGAANTFGIFLPLLLTRFKVYWRLVCLVSTAVPALAIPLISTSTESPVWLVLRGRLDQARAALSRLWGEEEGEMRLEEITSTRLGSSQHGRISRLKDPEVWRPFLIVNFTFVLQSLTGEIIGPEMRFYPSL